MPFSGRLSAAARHFLDTTSARGVPRTVRSHSTCLKVMWTLVVVGTVVWAIAQVSRLVADYLEYPTVNQVDYTHVNVSERKFPSVTICNLNPFPSNIENLTNVLSHGQFYQIMEEKLNEFNYGGKRSMFFRGVMSDAGYFQNVGLSNARKIGHDVDHLINYCTFFGIFKGFHSCLRNSKIRLFQHSDFFNCYTIEKSEPGVSEMDLIVYLDNFKDDWLNSYNPLFRTRETRGLRVSIHDQGIYPPIRESYMDFSPGESSNIALEGRAFHGISQPHGNCRVGDKNGLKWKYSRLLCEMRCVTQTVTSKSGCLLPEFYIMHDDNISHPFCGNARYLFYNASGAEVISRIRRPLTTSKEAVCDCPTPCYHTDYTTTISTTKWPWKSHHIAMYNSMISDKHYAWRFKVYEDIANISKFNDSEAKRKLDQTHLIENNFVHLKIFFKNNVVTTVRTKKMYDFDFLLGSIGGAMNFYCGITVIFLVEVVELIVNICVGFHTERRKGNSVNDSNEVEINNSKCLSTVSTKHR